jgi:hypothetical protein
MSKGVETIFVTRQETIILPKAKPIVVEGVHVTIRIRNFINRMEALLEEFQGVGAEEFISVN